MFMLILNSLSCPVKTYCNESKSKRYLILPLFSENANSVAMIKHVIMITNKRSKLKLISLPDSSDYNGSTIIQLGIIV